MSRDPTLGPHGQLMYTLPLAPSKQRYAHLELPADLTADEAARIGAIVLTLAVPTEGAVS